MSNGDAGLIAEVWVFTGPRAQFSSGVFSSKENAERWIARHSLTGTLTLYRLDEGAYDHALAHGLFKPTRDDQRSPEFISRFSGGDVHFHYENGQN